MIYRELSREEFDDLASRILYEDNHLLIVNKKVGEIVQGDKTSDEPLTETYKAFIAQRDFKPGQVFMGLPHRLDRPVSGIVVLAKTSKALERLNAMFRDSDVRKIYWALVCAEPKPAGGFESGCAGKAGTAVWGLLLPGRRPGDADPQQLRYHLEKAGRICRWHRNF